jgi:hypothetical protein
MPVKGWTGEYNNFWADKLGIDTTAEQKLYQETKQEAENEVNTTEATFNREEVIEACRVDLNFLTAIAMPTVFKHDFPPVLLVAWQLLTEGSTSLVKLFPQIALGIPRGHAKTTLIKLFILHCILFTSKKFPLILCDTAANAENIIADVAAMLNERNIIALFGDWTIGREIDRQNLKKFAYRGRIITLGALGAGGSVRGLNVNHARPDVMIFEDVQTKECSESILQSQALEKWMIGTAMKAKSPSGCTFVFVGNMYPGPNSILKKLKNNATWVKFISGAILADGTALWSELHSLQDLINELNNDISMGHPEIFFSEVLNDTEAGINSKTDLSKIADWKHGEFERPQGKFIIIDPANNKVGGDDVAIGYFEVYDGLPALREVIEQNISPGNTIRQALLMAVRHNCRLIAVESTAYQYSLLYWFNEISKQYGITGIEVVDIYSGSVSKNSKIADTLKALTANEIELHTSVKSRVTFQIANWNPLKRDNSDGLLDLLSYAPKVIELYGASILCDDALAVIEADAVGVLEHNSPF